NGAIGPALARHYWAPGNSIDHDSTLRNLTGEGFSARYLADECNKSVEEAWAEARRAIAAASGRTDRQNAPESLDAHIRIVHGAEVLADSAAGEDAMCTQFETWIREHYLAAPRGL